MSLSSSSSTKTSSLTQQQQQQQRISCWKCHGNGTIQYKNKNKKVKKTKMLKEEETDNEADVHNDGKVKRTNASSSNTTTTSSSSSSSTTRMSTGSLKICTVCNGKRYIDSSIRSKQLAIQKGQIRTLRGYPNNHPLFVKYQQRFWGTSAAYHYYDGYDGQQQQQHNNIHKLPLQLQPKNGEIVAPLGCGNWRIYQLANGNKLTVDDFICSYIAAKEIRSMIIMDSRTMKTGQLQQHGLQVKNDKKQDLPTSSYGDIMFGIVVDDDDDHDNMFDNYHDDNKKDDDDDDDINNNVQQDLNNVQQKPSTINHVDLGTGCGSVLMMIAWAFPSTRHYRIHSTGIEAQTVSYKCLQRGMKWNLGYTGDPNIDNIVDSKYDPRVVIQQDDIRTWDGYIRMKTKTNTIPAKTINAQTRVDNDKNNTSSSPTMNDSLNDEIDNNNIQTTRILRSPPYDIITGTPPYFPIKNFVSSPNHTQKVHCRIPIRGNASTYIMTASKLLRPNGGILVLVEASLKQANNAILQTVKQCPNLKIVRRTDIITRTGLPSRFSCWIIKTTISTTTTTTKTTTTDTITTSVNDHVRNKTNINMKKKRKHTDRKGQKNHHDINQHDNDNDDDNNNESNDDDNNNIPQDYVIDTMTLRNSDLIRTEEYSKALEVMGWQNYEKYPI